ncbi:MULTISPECIES: type II secretion system F family protein [Pandoraea]|uniref:Pilus assembly protein TadB n=1 Tax=Pandoraea cepalis TaxID=2508294 RepID=A0A5E4U5Y2_9BURK|nr:MULTISPECIES: type II secretion system F family protein [Pandoraea]QBC32121.1 pilus assembly protein TadB [Pandoraea sp. XY-2]VVD94304.1 pilus assembly protein TadB [Pandoraea cepalis]
MNAIVLWVIGIALLLIAAGLELWRRTHQRVRAQATSAFLERQLAQSAPRFAASEGDAARAPRRKSLPWEFFFERAGVQTDPTFYAMLVAPGLLMVMLFWMWHGPLSAIVVLLMYAVGTVLRYWFKAARRHRNIVRQLPIFLDGMVRMLTVGNSLPAAFQTAAGNADMPLRELLDRAVRQVQAGVDLDVALKQIARVYHVEEIYLFASVVDLSTRFGGRADQILSRMAGFMRDREQAQAELYALSSETRLSAWVLAALPIIVSAVLMLLNPRFFEPMFQEASGQRLLAIGLGLEVFGGFLLYRLAKSL